MDDQWLNKVEGLFKKQYQELCLIAYSYIADLDEAEDIVQDVFISLLKRENPNILDIERYVKRSVKNASLNKIRQSKRIEPITEKVLKLPHHENQQRINHDEEIKTAIQNLPLQCKKVFELCALEGQKYSTAAETLNISVNTVKSHMKKAYKILRVELEDTQLFLLLLLISQ
jgi:RNA polymerase sigma-70 factor (ECF subfamily)